MCGDMKVFERLPGESLLELEVSLDLLTGTTPSNRSISQQATVAAVVNGTGGTSGAAGRKKNAGPKVTASGKIIEFVKFLSKYAIRYLLTGTVGGTLIVSDR